MIPLGYMAKRVAVRPDWLRNDRVDEIVAVSSCMSKNFEEDWIDSWRHNGFWFFDSLAVIKALAVENDIDLEGVRWFYLEGYEFEFVENGALWRRYGPDVSLPAPAVEKPGRGHLRGYDVVTFSSGTTPECSPLSCNGLAERVQVNRHCLLGSFEEAKRLIEEGAFRGSEPGPYRIISVFEAPP